MKNSAEIPASRKIRGTLDIFVGLLIIAAYVDLLSGQVAEGTFTPETHFAYLTNQTSYSNIAVLIAGAFSRGLELPILCFTPQCGPTSPYTPWWWGWSTTGY